MQLNAFCTAALLYLNTSVFFQPHLQYILYLSRHSKPLCLRKVYERIEVQINTLLTVALGGDEQSAPRPSHCTDVPADLWCYTYIHHDSEEKFSSSTNVRHIVARFRV